MTESKRRAEAMAKAARALRSLAKAIETADPCEGHFEGTCDSCLHFYSTAGDSPWRCVCGHRPRPSFGCADWEKRA